MNVVTTLGLVGATVGLVYVTRQLVGEARLSRADAALVEARAIRPRLAFDAMVLGGKVGMLLIRNVGNGPAFDVELTLRFRQDGSDETRGWAEPSVVPGESHELNLPSPAREDIATLGEHPIVVYVLGSMRDLDGRVLAVSDTFDMGA